MKPLRQIFAFIAIIAASTPPHGFAQEWPGWGGPNGNFVLNDTGALKSGQKYRLEIAWKKPIGSGYSAVSVQGDLAVTLFSDGISDYVVGLNTQDGTERWKYRVGPTFLGHYGAQTGPLSTPLITSGKVIGLGPHGKFFALDAATGNEVWAIDLVASQRAITPFYGFTSSPRIYQDLLFLQTGGPGENAMTAFNPDSGDVIWSAGSDSVNYQSPGIFRVGGQDHLVFHGNKTLYGLVPETGKVLWQFDHGGQNNATGTSGHPVEIAEGLYFLKNRGNGGKLLRVLFANETYNVEEVWRSQQIRSTYIYAVHHEGYLYGYNRRILNCVDAESGERVWRSREPGDGLPMIIDNHLVIMTKDGKLAIAQTTEGGYREITRLKLFDDIVWTPASLADGKFYARSMSEIACVEIIPESAPLDLASTPKDAVPGSRFERFIEDLNRASDKKLLVDQFISRQELFPVIEGDNLAHFLYRGEARDVTMTGDIVGRRIDQPMERIAGTDLFYYSTDLESDARITYHYTLDLQRTIPDPLNPRNIRSLFFGRASWFSMPAWRVPEHLEKRQDGIQGRIDSIRFESDSIKGSKKLTIYLPMGYDHNEDRYPVAFVHDARRPLTLGKVDVSLDNLIGNSVRPVIVVFLPSLVGGGYTEYVGAKRDEYARVFFDEVLPFVEENYRTIQSREGRANIGMVHGAFMAFYATFTRPDLFSNLAIQTMYWDQTSQAHDEGLIPPRSENPVIHIYYDWGKYDLRSPMEGNDLGKSSEVFAQLLQDRGYSFTGGVVNDGTGWASWRNRTDVLFGTLFPVVD